MLGASIAKKASWKTGLEEKQIDLTANSSIEFNEHALLPFPAARIRVVLSG